jgi:beta-glucanase (GH16 family)
VNIRFLALTAILAPLPAAPPAPPPPAGYVLAWGDDFFLPPGAAPDPARWNFERGGGGWGNGELETYVDDRAHCRVVADPACADGRALQITATADGRGGYRSARITTERKAAPRYGYIEARMKLPAGRGLWPAFWMLGDDIGTAGWPDCGEIDILENLGREPSVAHGTLHGPGYSGGSPLSAAYTLPGGGRLSDGYHTYAARWDPGSITFLVDGAAYGTFTPRDLKPGQRWVFGHPFFFLLNVAVGGGWPGPPDAATRFPQALRVDYVRVYQRPAGAARAAAPGDSASGPATKQASDGGTRHGTH